MSVRVCIALMAALGLAACALDSVEAVRANLKTWLWPGAVLEFSSRPTCTAAVFELATPGLRPTARVAHTIEAGLADLRAGRVVAFAVADHGPHAISQAIMSRDLGIGLGLLSNGVGPADRCLSERYGPDYYNALLAPRAITIFDAANNALIVVHPGVNLVFFMRGNV